MRCRSISRGAPTHTQNALAIADGGHVSAMTMGGGLAMLTLLLRRRCVRGAEGVAAMIIHG